MDTELCSMQKALFLDRDGVVNYDPGDYTKSLSEFQILPTVMPALKMAHDKGYLLILITNQGGIAKGLYTHNDVAEIHAYLCEKCAENGSPLTHIYYSPHHDDFGRSLSRKPGSLMIERSCARFQIDPARSMMIGDKQRDLDAAAKVGVPGILMKANAPLIKFVELLA